MRAVFETGFYYVYLAFIIGLGIYLLIKKKSIYFSLACIILGVGDAFHLIPRAIGLYTKTLDNPSTELAMYLGIGKLITSITMTLFYVLMYLYIYQRVNKKRPLCLDITVTALALARFILLAFPQNGWTVNSNDIYWGLYRNIPFILLGILVIYLLAKYFRGIKHLRLLFIADILSFAFYLPVVFLASTYSWVGLLMLPKTICYMWIAIAGYLDIKKQ